MIFILLLKIRNKYLTKNKCKVNDKTGIKFFIENTCNLLINKKLTNKQIIRIDAQFRLICKTIFYIQENRHFERKFII